MMHYYVRWESTGLATSYSTMHKPSIALEPMWATLGGFPWVSPLHEVVWLGCSDIYGKCQIAY